MRVIVGIDLPVQIFQLIGFVDQFIVLQISFNMLPYPRA